MTATLHIFPKPRQEQINLPNKPWLGVAHFSNGKDRKFAVSDFAFLEKEMGSLVGLELITVWPNPYYQPEVV